VEIGSQCWTAENLKVERYRNGDNIPTGLSDADWGVATSGAFAVYNDDAANKAIYGLLYNWYTAVDPRGLCPTGWHVPANEEWTALTDYLGGAGSAGGQMKTTGNLSDGTGLWTSPNVGATNSSGFSGLPAGGRTKSGSFSSLGNGATWWSSSPLPPFAAWTQTLAFYYGVASLSPTDEEAGYSIRCLRD
jgi:uncharacterized protein (TIGR02145 family)